jgi:hypothetical protein
MDSLVASYNWLPNGPPRFDVGQRDKAVLIRSRRESRFGSETMLSTADLAYVVSTKHDYTIRVLIVSTPRVFCPFVVIFPNGMHFTP